MKEFIEILKVIFLGIIEGITEWLPISSTGHMILVDEFIKLQVSENFKELFLVVIQLGAILAVPVVFWKKLFPFGKSKSEDEKKRIWSLWFKVAIGVVPAVVLGLLLDDLLDKYLYNYVVVSVALVVYGVAFILIERLRKNKEYRIDSVYDISYRDALIIGAYQTLSLIPGTSRSGSTILGGMLTGVSRTASAEFSFFMAIPVMLGASGLKVLKFIAGGYTATSLEICLLLIGILVSFAVSLVVIEFLMSFVKKHSFSAFGIYRIVLGAVVLAYFIAKVY
ncbi:MAG: undecaprenyl-diphosphate phosphatase [Clostridia bacterium]|nr:undecaprenyl-diphosphate phosphatase [Clostridia bacterium]